MPQSPTPMLRRGIANGDNPARHAQRGRGARMESAGVAQARGAVDLAIIGAIADGGLRRSEAAALTWGDVDYYQGGTARITLQRGKNHPAPFILAVTESTARALRAIQPDGAAGAAAPVFGLTSEALANRVCVAARAAGLGNDLSGHSGRIGMARRMATAGAPTAAVAPGTTGTRSYVVIPLWSGWSSPITPCLIPGLGAPRTFPLTRPLSLWGPDSSPRPSTWSG